MAASLIDKFLWRRGLAKSTAKALAGRRYEAIGRIYCLKKRYRILARNRRVGRGEIDILAQDRAGKWVAIEVRGRSHRGFIPSQFLTQRKWRAIHHTADLWMRYERLQVRVELVQIVGPLPQGRLAFVWLCLKIYVGMPTSLAIKMFEVDDS